MLTQIRGRLDDPEVLQRVTRAEESTLPRVALITLWDFHVEVVPTTPNCGSTHPSVKSGFDLGASQPSNAKSFTDKRCAARGVT